MTSTETSAAKKNGNGNGAHSKAASSKASRFSEEFKATAVRRALAGEKVETIAKEMGTTAYSVYNWKHRMAKSAVKPAAGKKTAKATGKHLHEDTAVRDAILYLRNARASIQRDLNEGKIKHLNDAQLLTMLALNVLENA